MYVSTKVNTTKYRLKRIKCFDKCSTFKFLSQFITMYVNVLNPQLAQWFELVVFTASMEIYGKAVCDELDSGQGMLRRRYYRQHCTLLPPGDSESYSKDLSKVCADLSRVFIIDNNPEAYTSYPDNAIPIRSWFSDPQDTALLQLLPLLDRLRRVSDVRTILRSPGLSDFSDSDSEE